jgi:hypothetical protein
LIDITRFGAPRRGEHPLGRQKAKRQQESPADGIVAACFFVETSARLVVGSNDLYVYHFPVSEKGHGALKKGNKPIPGRAWDTVWFTSIR